MHKKYLAVLFAAFICVLSATSQQLEIIDPANNHQILWSACTKSTSLDQIHEIVSDHDAHMYMVGGIGNSMNETWPLINTFYGGNSDAFLNKVNMEGDVIWSMLIGGTGDDVGLSVSLGEDGNIIVAGETNSTTDFTMNSSSQYNGGSNDLFIAKITPDGVMLWNHYYGGIGSEQCRSLSCSASGLIAISGSTSSTNLINNGGAQPTFGGGSMDGFVAVMNDMGVVQWNSYIGGTANEEVNDVVFFNEDNLFLCGAGASIPLISAHAQNPMGGGMQDGFLAGFDASGNTIWATYFGGDNNDNLAALDITESGNIILTGQSSSGSLDGIENSLFTQPGNPDVVILSYTTAGVYNWGQFIGGSEMEIAGDVCIDFFNTIYVSGTTGSNDLPTLDAFQTSIRGGTDNFLMKMDESGATHWTTYVGGSGNDFINSMDVDRMGKVYLAGLTHSHDLSMLLPNQELSSEGDGFVSKISDCNNPNVEIHTPDAMIFCDGEEAILIACGALHYNWVTGDTTVVSFADSAMTYFVDGFNHEGCNSRSNPMTFEVLETPVVEAAAGGPTTFCGEGSVMLYAVGCDSIRWNNGMVGSEILADTNRIFIAIGIAENGCTATSEPIEVVFVDLPVIAMAIVEDTVCISDAPIPMISIPEGGTFIGQGTVIPGWFNPFAAGGGQHDIYYSYTDENGCTGISPPVSVFVMSHPTVIFDAVDTMCVFDPSIELLGDPLGGVFEGDGVVGNTFTPASSGNGPQNIIYSYVDENGCTNIDSHIIQVELCASVEDDSEFNVSLFPNPAAQDLFVSSAHIGQMHGQIYDISGALIYDFNSNGMIRVDVTSFPAGLYMLVLDNGLAYQTNQFTVIK